MILNEMPDYPMPDLEQEIKFNQLSHLRWYTYYSFLQLIGIYIILWQSYLFLPLCLQRFINTGLKPTKSGTHSINPHSSFSGATEYNLIFNLRCLASASLSSKWFTISLNSISLKSLRKSSLGFNINVQLRRVVKIIKTKLLLLFKYRLNKIILLPIYL